MEGSSAENLLSILNVLQGVFISDSMCFGPMG